MRNKRNAAIAIALALVVVVALAIVLALGRGTVTDLIVDGLDSILTTPTPAPTPDMSYLENIQQPLDQQMYLSWAYRPLSYQQAPDVSVAAPTWLYVEADDEGRAVLRDVCEMGRETDYAAYLEAAHADGLEVWVCVVSFDDALSEQVLTDEAVRTDFLEKLVSFANEWDFDGINFDFEYMNPIYKQQYTELVRLAKEAAPELQVSVAVTVIEPKNAETNWYQCYDHEGLGEVADHIMIMTYQTNTTYELAGPVAPYPWLEKKIIQELYEVPSNKIVLGIPFYCYEYVYELVDGEETPPEEKRIHARPLSTVYYLLENDAYSETNDPIVDEWLEVDTYDPVTKSYTARFVSTEGNVHVIYYDTPESLAEKALLMKDYNLGGAAVWVWSYGNEALWTKLGETVALPDEE